MQRAYRESRVVSGGALVCWSGTVSSELGCSGQLVSLALMSHTEQLGCSRETSQRAEKQPEAGALACGRTHPGLFDHRTASLQRKNGLFQFWMNSNFLGAELAQGLHSKTLTAGKGCHLRLSPMSSCTGQRHGLTYVKF